MLGAALATVSGVHSVALCEGHEHVGCGLMNVPLACQNSLEEDTYSCIYSQSMGTTLLLSTLSKT